MHETLERLPDAMPTKEVRSLGRARAIVQSFNRSINPERAATSGRLPFARIREKVVAASVRLELGLPSSLTSRSPLLKQTTSMRLRYRTEIRRMGSEESVYPAV